MLPRSHVLREGKKAQFILVESGDISLTTADVQELSTLLTKISPFADPNDYTSEENKIWLSILDGLARHESFKVVNELAINTSTPASYLEAFLDERDDLFLSQTIRLRYSIALNPSTPPYLLEKMYYSNNLVREDILSNPSTPIHILEDAYKNEECIVCLARNPASSKDWLRDFAFRVSSNYKHYDKVLQYVSQNPSTPRDVLEKLAFVCEEWMNGVAKNPSTPEDLLRKLSEQTYVPFQQLALNPSTPLDLLESFRTSVRDEWQLILRNESMPPERLEYYYENYKQNWKALHNLALNPSTPGHILEAIFGKDDPLLNPDVLQNVSAPASLLTFTRDKSKTIIAANPATPIDILYNYYHHAIQENDIDVLVALASNERGLRTT